MHERQEEWEEKDEAATTRRRSLRRSWTTAVPVGLLKEARQAEAEAAAAAALLEMREGVARQGT